MRFLKKNFLARLLNSYIVDSPEPVNISYLWNFGSLLGLCLVIQIVSGIFLAMHYQPHVDFAFNSVEHIMRDVNNGWAVRYTHANVASFFFIFVYAHIGRGLYYGSYKAPRIALWTIGVIILILMMAIAFLGYVLPYGQMSLWGIFDALNVYFNNLNLIKNLENFLIYNIMPVFFPLTERNHLILTSSPLTLAGRNKDVKEEEKEYIFTSHTSCSTMIGERIKMTNKKLKGIYRIGPHDKEIYSIIFGSLLGDAYAEKRVEKGGTRISFYQESTHLSYIIWLHKFLSLRGYTGFNLPQPKTRLGSKGKVRKVVRFHTWTYTSFNWIQEIWYKNNIKIVPSCIANYLTPLALAVWIMDDGCKIGKGLKLSTNAFSYLDCILLVTVLNDNFNLKATIQSAGAPNQHIIYINKESMPLLRNIVLPYIIPEMKYKIIE